MTGLKGLGPLAFSAPSIVLVAHGSTSGGAAGTAVGVLADRLRARPDAGPVEIAFLHGSPNLPQALARLAEAREVWVLPMFAAEGHFTASVIPAAIATAAALRPHQLLRQLPPIGTHAGYVSSIARRLRRLVSHAGIDLGEMAFLAIGHGSRHAGARDRDAAEGLARSLRSECRSSEALYLDCEPRADAWASRVTETSVVVAPVFFSDAGHARCDVPRLFGLGHRTPATADAMVGPITCQGKTIWYAELPPSTACVADLILDLARADPDDRADRRLVRERA